MRPGERARRQSGFTLIAVFAAMFLLALGSELMMAVLSQQAQREREAELLRIGAAYADAIRSYYLSTPGAIKRWPRGVADLVDDRRFVQVKRHLREAYADPITRKTDWGIVPAPDGGMAGVFSRSGDRPIREGSVEAGEIILPAAERYSDWVFVHVLPEVQPARVAR